MSRLLFPWSGTLLVIFLSQGCITSRVQETGFESLRVGMRVEAEGRKTGARLEAEEVEVLGRGDRDKIELNGRAETDLRRNSLRLLGQEVRVVERTGFENERKEAIPPFPVRAGDWIKVKARIKEGGGLRARTLRRIPARDRFEVEGTITDLDPGRRQLMLGPLPLHVLPGAKVHLERERTGDPLTLFLEDEQKSVPFTLKLTEDLFLGGELTTKGEGNDEYDLDRRDPGDRNSLRLEGKLDLLWHFPDRASFLHLEGRVGRLDRFRKGEADTTRKNEGLSRAYAWFDLSDRWKLQVGRQDFDEEREWLYDEILDGARLIWMEGSLMLEGSASMGREIFEERNETEDTSTFMGVGRWFLDENHHLSAYAIQRKDSSPLNFEPFLFGLRSFSRPGGGLGHWFELSRASGYQGFTKIEGHAVDAGLMWRIRGFPRPTFTLGYAFAGGSPDPARRIGFRQTGLQDNNGKFGGVTSFRYFGEVLEPELSNLEVTTLGFGIRPTRSFSLDFVLHGFRQDEVQASLASTRLRAAPNGRFRDLGWELDLVLGYRAEDWLVLELIGGRFDPGRAFDDQDVAHKLELQVRLKF